MRCSRRWPMQPPTAHRLRADNGQTLGELCARLSMTRQAVSKHLAILEEQPRRRGGGAAAATSPVPIHDIADRWIGNSRLQALGDLSTWRRVMVTAEATSRNSYRHHSHHATEVMGGADRSANDQEYWFGMTAECDFKPGSSWGLKSLRMAARPTLAKFWKPIRRRDW